MELLDSTGKEAVTIKQLTRRADSDNTDLTFRFKVRPAVKGILFYRLNVATEGDAPEANQANNQRVVVIDRGGGPYRVLYLAGRPNWEYKFLQRAVSEDEQVDLVGLIRVARKRRNSSSRGARARTPIRWRAGPARMSAITISPCSCG